MSNNKVYFVMRKHLISGECSCHLVNSDEFDKIQHVCDKEAQTHIYETIKKDDIAGEKRHYYIQCTCGLTSEGDCFANVLHRWKEYLKNEK